ncbi:MAG TPA: alkaline phosphatase family protein, partial [Caulobacterales bacterium]|nr:alkaline phosphatase family protein [Caulobacterales bacterium]
NRDWPPGQLPSGFLAMDLAHALNMPLFQSNGFEVALNQGITPRGGHAYMGPDFEHPHVVVAANGGSDLIYLTADDARTLAPRIVETLTQQDYVSAIFVDDSYGDIPGALPLSAIRFVGDARTPRPAIVVSFRSFGTGCDNPEICAAEIADTGLEQGQGMHGSLSRAETRNFMAAVGPDFRTRFVDPAPVSNADIAPTIAHILGFELASQGALRGRVASEALLGGAPVAATSEIKRATPAANGFATLLNLQRVGDVEYYDAAGAEGRAVGLRAQ